jgi:solute carrier family 20 (sodium-dependent phosphate transporter)
LTLNQAILIAAIFEFVGAMVLGRVSTSTIAGGIADPKQFATQPFAYAYGMMWTLLAGGLWQGWASKNGLNVSATHSIIAGIIGFALAFNGKEGVLWIVDDPLSIPPYKGVVPIVIAWFFAPIATAFCSASMFAIVRLYSATRTRMRDLSTCFQSS